MKKCTNCGNEFAFLKYSYYYDINGKEKILCDSCRKIIEYKEKEIKGRNSEFNEKITRCPNCGRVTLNNTYVRCCAYCGKKFFE